MTTQTAGPPEAAPRDKVMELDAAIAAHVHDGDTICPEGFGHLIPFAAAHEIIRQGRRGLTLVRMTPDLIADQLIAADCVDRLVASFFASGSAGSLHEVRRRIQHHDPRPLEVEEWTHGQMAARYSAGATGAPFLPVHSGVGSDLFEVNPMLRSVEDPYGGGRVAVVPPIRPDVTILHAQRADRLGNVQLWGITGIQPEAAYAGRRTIVTVEEIVEPEVVRSDPNRTLIPAHAVTAVVPVPRGAHPSYVQGYYQRDNAFYREWEASSKDRSRLLAWLDEWVHGVVDRAAYVQRLGEERWASVRLDPRPAAPVDYGRTPRNGGAA